MANAEKMTEDEISSLVRTFNMEPKQSAVGTLNTTDWKKIGMGALMAMGGALIAYLSTIIKDIDFGEYAYIAIPVASILLNIIRKLLEGKSN